VGGEHFHRLPVERATPGLSTGPEEKKLGIRGSSTRQVILEDARAGTDKVLARWAGAQDRVQHLNIGRFKLGAGSVGAAKDCCGRPPVTRRSASSSAGPSRASA